MYNKIMIAPNTDLILLKCPIELDQANQLTFSNATAQYNYFNSLSKLEVSGFTYQRKDGKIRYPASADDLYQFNYCMYRNSSYSNKWFYAFITNIEYLNDNTSLISISTDVWQTWQFDLNFKASFIAREHVNNDTIGIHTIPEGLEYGEYICNGVQNAVYADTSRTDTVMIVFQVTTLDVSHGGTTAKFPSATRQMFNGIPQGCFVFALPYSMDGSAKISTVAGYYDAAGKRDAIVAIFLCPRACCLWDEAHGEGTLADETFYVPRDSMTSRSLIVPLVTRNTSLDGYVPHNNKLYCAPYNVLYVSNNAGGDCVYQWELFNGDPAFEVRGAVEQGGAIMLTPQNSKKSAALPSVTGDGWNEGLPAGKLPNLSWSSDYYLNWEAINGANIQVQAGLTAAKWAINVGSNLLNAGADGAEGYGSSGDRANLLMGAVESTLDLASSVANIAQQIKEAEIVPPTAKGNVSTGSIGFSSGESKFTFRKMSIRAEYARIIDSYFDAFGYQVNALKVPNLTGRANWNYIKTVGCNVIADIPQEDLNRIKRMFNTGLTLWHNPVTFLDYSQNNNIV